MAKYSWLIFDADGTLFDYDLSESRALRAAFESLGLEADKVACHLYREINSLLWKEFEKGRVSSAELRVLRFEKLLLKLGSGVSPEALSGRYLQKLGDEAHLLRGAREVLLQLAPHFGLVLATNGIADVQRNRIAISGIGEVFQEIVISDEIGVAKPHPAYFEELFSRIGNPEPGETLIIGDNLSSDIAGGLAFGIDTCWFNPMAQPNTSPWHPRYEISQLQEIPGLLTIPS